MFNNKHRFVFSELKEMYPTINPSKLTNQVFTPFANLLYSWFELLLSSFGFQVWWRNGAKAALR